MKFLSLLIPSLLALSFLLIGCGKIELPSDEESKNDTIDSTDIDNDKTDVIPAGTDTLTVAEVLSDTTTRYVLVRGYIVGYCSTTSNTSVVFGIAATSANTNMLLADSPDETDVNNCLPVFLTKDARRDSLNLYDHPENYKRRIVVYGRASHPYFESVGIKTITDYSWCTDESTPDTPSDTTTTPTIDDNAQDNVDGR